VTTPAPLLSASWQKVLPSNLSPTRAKKISPLCNVLVSVETREKVFWTRERTFPPVASIISLTVSSSFISPY
jgi:hypothetical protein